MALLKHSVVQRALAILRKHNMDVVSLQIAKSRGDNSPQPMGEGLPQSMQASQCGASNHGRYLTTDTLSVAPRSRRDLFIPELDREPVSVSGTRKMLIIITKGSDNVSTGKRGFGGNVGGVVLSSTPETQRVTGFGNNPQHCDEPNVLMFFYSPYGTTSAYKFIGSITANAKVVGTNNIKPVIDAPNIVAVIQAYYYTALTGTHAANAVAGELSTMLSPSSYTGVTFSDYLISLVPEWHFSRMNGNLLPCEKIVTLVPIDLTTLSKGRVTLTPLGDLQLGVTQDVTGDLVELSTILYPVNDTVRTIPPAIAGYHVDHVTYVGIVCNPSGTAYPIVSNEPDYGGDVYASVIIRTSRTGADALELRTNIPGTVVLDTTAVLPIPLGNIAGEMLRVTLKDNVDATAEVWVKAWVNETLVRFWKISSGAFTEISTARTVMWRREITQTEALSLYDPILWHEEETTLGITNVVDTETLYNLGYLLAGGQSNDTSTGLMSGGSYPIYSANTGATFTRSIAAAVNTLTKNSSQTNTGSSVSTGEFTAVIHYQIWKGDTVDTETAIKWNGSSIPATPDHVVFHFTGGADVGLLAHLEPSDDTLTLQTHKTDRAKDITGIPIISGRSTRMTITRDASNLIEVRVFNEVIGTITSAGDTEWDEAAGFAFRKTTAGRTYSATAIKCGSASAISEAALFDEVLSDTVLADMEYHAGGNIQTSDGISGIFQDSTEPGTAWLIREDTFETVSSTTITDQAFEFDYQIDDALVVVLFGDTATRGYGGRHTFDNGPNPLPASAYVAPDGLTGTHKVTGIAFEDGVNVACPVAAYKTVDGQILAKVTSTAGSGAYEIKFNYSGDVTVVKFLPVALVDVECNIVPTLI